MSYKELSISNTASQITGWVGLAAMILIYVALYTVNYWLPIERIDYTSRIWNWSQIALTVTACLTLIMHGRLLTTRAVLLGFALGTLSTLSHWSHDPGLSWSLQEGVGVWLCFLAGSILFKDRAVICVAALQPPLVHIGRSVGLGILFAIPLRLSIIFISI